MAFLIFSIVIISAVAAFLLLKKQDQALPVEQPAPVVVETVEVVKKPEPKKKMTAKPVEKNSIVVEKAPAKKPAKKGK
jgi:hypothetical protein